MLRAVHRFAGFVAVLVLACSPAHAQKRVALVIGNSAYANVTKLPNPSRDAAAVEGMLRTAGFDVVQRVTDLSGVAMRRALRDFSDQVRDADIAVVFYAGHGIEVNGSNYLVPVDAVLERDIDVEDETVSLDRIGQMLEQAKRLRLIILDACRDNPFAKSMKRTLATRSIGRGLAKVEIQSSDTLVAYAAKAGSTAGDGDGQNSPYTRALIEHLATPGLDVRLALGRVRDTVLKSTNNRQEPFVYGSLGGAEISLVPGDAKPSVSPPVQAAPVQPSPDSQTAAQCERYWDKIKGATSAYMFDDYIRICGSSAHAADAQGMLALLKMFTNAAPAPLPATKAPPAAENAKTRSTPDDAEGATESITVLIERNGKACSAEADERNLHGVPRKEFRAACIRNGPGKQ